ncbi:MAG: amino acid adenylation domain-containing protein, partial [bacterium]|nr:amino acid adenylation domain-containing protein [bacterium]
MEKTFQKLIHRQESLRTTFHMIDPVTPEGLVTPGRITPVQIIDETPEFKIEKYPLKEEEAGRQSEQVKQDFFRPFDLTRAPLIRVAVVGEMETTTAGEGKTLLREGVMLVDMHHIITDAASQEILVSEFVAMYDGESLPPLKVQYKDYAEWRNRSKQKQLKKQQEQYWLKTFPGELPVLTLPTDFTRPAIQSFEGNKISFQLNKDETGSLKEITRENGTTLYMTILSIFTIMLSKLSGQEDIIVGTPTAGRRHADLEKIIGMFVNTLAMRNYPEGGKAIEEYLREVKGKTLQAFENQDYQFDDLVDRLSVRRDTGRNPIFDVMFNQLNQSGDEEQDTFTPHVETASGNTSNAGSNSDNTLPDEISKFDLTLNALDTPGSLFFHFEYCTKLFKKKTINRFITYFKVIVQTISKAPTQKIEAVEIITREEREQILYEFNDTAADFPREKTIHQLFEEQVEKTPDNIGLVGSRQLAVGKEKIKDKNKIKSNKETKKQLLQTGDSDHTLQDDATDVGGIHESPLQTPLTHKSLLSTPSIPSTLSTLSTPSTHKSPISPQHPSSIQLTYRELNEKANRLAHFLQNKGAKPGTIVAIMMKRSIDLIIGLLAILKTGAAYLPIDPNSPGERVDYMLKDSSTGLFLVDDKSGIRMSASETKPNNSTPVVVGHNSNDPKSTNHSHSSFPNSQYTVPDNQANDPAYIIYTSGTTGRPKGTVIMHRSLVNLCTWHNRYYGITGEDNATQYASIAFDAAVWEIFPYLVKGATIHIIDEKIKLEIQRLSNYYRRENITVSFLPTQFCRQFMEEAGEIPSLRILLAGGDKLKHYVKQEYKLYNDYGPTENTVVSTVFHVKKQSGNIPIGKPIANVQIYIMNKRNLKLQPVGVAGELCISGENLALGYLNNPELTAERFTKASWQSAVGSWQKEKESAIREKTSSIQLYRTGDLARWLPDGNIEFLGRIDYQVKIRGYRIELGEIESGLLTHPEIKEAVVLSRESKNGDNILCAYYVENPQQPTSGIQHPSSIQTFLSKLLPHYMIPAFFIKLEKIPLTPNGKIDRKALSQFPISNIQSPTYIAPKSETEKALTQIWAEILEIKKEAISINSNFFQLGGHSLKATIMMARIQKKLTAAVPLSKIFRTPTIRELAAYIEGTGKNTRHHVKTVENREYYPLSYNQQRMYILHEMQPDSTAYNIPGYVDLEHAIEPKDAKKILDVLISRHESLRTLFKKVDDQPRQFIVKTVKNPLETIDVSTLETAEKKQTLENIYKETASKPFDLTRPPLLRARLIKMASQNYRLMFNLHHIITDGWSQEILKKEFIRIYESIRDGEKMPLPPLALQYKDYAIWNKKQLSGEEGKESFLFWKKKLSAGIPIMHLPADTVVEKEDRKGAAYRSKIGKDLKEQLLKLAETNQTTLFTVLFSAYLQLLSRLTHQQEICSSIISSGREHYKTHNIIGFFVNSLLFKIEIDENEPFNALLKKVGGQLSETLRHQAYPLETVCERLKMKYPEIPVTINMLNISENAAKEELPSPGPDSHTGLGPDSHTGLGPDGEEYHLENYPDVKFDLEPYFTENSDGIDMCWAYKKNMFEPLTIEHIVQRYIKYLDYFVKNPDRSLKDRRQQIVNEKPGKNEKEKITGQQSAAREKNHTIKTGKGATYILIEKFERQAAKTPGNIAVKSMRKTYTYKNLNRTANRIARQILKTAPGKTVGLFFQQGYHMIAAILGTLKAGKIYVPLSVEYPGKRLVYMLEDSGATLLLTNSSHEPEARKLARTIRTISILNIDEINAGLAPGAVGPPTPDAASTAKSLHLTGMEPVKEDHWNPEDDVNPHREVRAGTDKIAYILYTSGTTGRPKGVAQTHANVDYYIRNWIRRLSITSADRMTLLASFCHDGSVPDIYSALFTGATLYPYNMKDSDQTIELTQMLIEEKITIWHSVPSLFSYFSNTLPGGKTFPQLRLIILGGEAVRRHEVDMLKKHYPQSKMANIYGQTEATVNTICLMDQYYRYKKCLIGDPLDETQIIIAGEAGYPVETLEVGEILVASQYIAPGYWNRSETTTNVFIQHEIYGNVYRTGDLGRQLADGTIEFLGRRDHQVKIRGYRVEPGEIETNLLEHTKISETVITLRENEDGEKYLCAYYVADRSIETNELRNFLMETLPDYMIPSHFTRLEKMPLTPGGKTDRNALPEPAALHTLQQYTAPRNDREKELTRIWAETLNIEKNEIGIDNDFFQIGGHSLKATIIVSKIHKQFDVKLPLSEIFKKTSVRTQTETINELSRHNPDKYAAIEPAEKKEYYTLSSAQKRLYILQQMELESTVYNMPYIIPLVKFSASIILRDVFKKLIRRHESLRTTFHMHPVPNNQSPLTHNQLSPVQTIHEKVEFRIEYYKPGTGEHEPGSTELSVLDEAKKAFFRPFDLSMAPLLRVGLVETSGTKNSAHDGFLMLDMHHIITDGTSLEVMTKEFFVLYDGESLAPLKLQYRDYVEWQSSSKQKELIKQQEEYWKNQLAGEVPVLTLPTDFTRPEIQSFEGNRVSFVLNKDETGSLEDTAKENEATLYMTILSIFTILLAKLSGQEDIIVGTPTTGRRHADLENIIGMFVNTLAMRNYPEGKKTFREFLREVKESTLKAFENQEYQFEDLVEGISVKRDTGRNPVFDVMLNLLNQSEYTSMPTNTNHSNQNNMQAATSENDTNASKDDSINTTSKFDLNLSCSEAEGKIFFRLEYCTKLFKPKTIDRFVTYFKTIMKKTVEKPLQKVSEIAIITKEEQKQILYEFNAATLEYPGDKTIHELFGEQAAKTPDNIGLLDSRLSTQSTQSTLSTPSTHKSPISPQHPSSIQHPASSIQLTYRELNKKSNTLAYILQSRGVKPGTIVAIMLERSIEMIIGLLGILKAGGAYLPIDPDYPSDRIDYMLKDSNAKVVLTESGVKNRLDKLSGDIEIIESEKPRSDELCVPPASIGPAAPTNPHPVSDLAYVIYTSGSTGKPKGVMIEHRNLVNLLCFQFKATPIDFSRVLQFTTIGFDVAAQEIFSTLLSGGRLSLIAKETLADIPALFDLVRRDQIKTLFFPASFLMFTMTDEAFLPLIPSTVRHIVTAGEQVVVNDKFREYLQREKVSLHNHYGPSETHVVTTLTLEPGEEIPVLPGIGKPITNTAIYIMDKGGNLLPQNIAGELYIGGDAVGRGYLNKPELTAERFTRVSRQLAVGSRQKEKEERAKEKGRQLQKKRTGPHNKSFWEFGTLFSKRVLAPGGPPEAPVTDGIYYRTGDLARWLPDGNIEFLGRIDHQVKIRGHRVELGEIENRLLTHPEIKEAVVLDRESKEGEKFLCAYYVGKSIPTPGTGTASRDEPRVRPSTQQQEPNLNEYLAHYLPDYMIPAFFIKLEKIPLTPNGKIDRKELSQFPISNIQFPTYVAPKSETEIALTQIWSEILGLEKNTISINTNFFQLGGHSLRATIMVSKIHKAFNIKLPLAELFKKTTVRTQAETITEFTRHKQEKYVAIEPTEKKEYYNLSAAQKRLYILQQMELATTAYNMPRIIPLAKGIDPLRLKNAFRKLIQRHESLRTSFHMITPLTQSGANPVTPGEEIPVQVVHCYSDIQFTIEEEGARGDKSTFFRPFDLTGAPLLRVGLIKEREAPDSRSLKHGEPHSSGESFLLLDMHHIITDGTSQEVLTKEFFALYAGENLPPLKLQYRDYAEWQNSIIQKESMKQQEEFWITLFADELPVLNLPTDYPRPVIQSFEGNKISFELKKEDANYLKETAKENETTLYMTMLAIFTIVLSKLNGQEDIIVGTPTAGRRHADLENIIGMFVNTLAMRNYPDGDKSIETYLKEVKENTLNAFENQEYQFEDLVDRLSVRRDTGRNPIFDVMFNLLSKAEYKKQNTTTTPINNHSDNPSNSLNSLNSFTTSRFDLTINALDTGDSLYFNFEYCTKLFKDETIKRFITYFKGILQAVYNTPHQKISEIEIITEEEKKQILYEFNDTAADYPCEKTIHQVFGEQVEKTPDNISTVGSWQFAVGKEKIKDKKEIKEQRGLPDVGGIHESPLQPAVQITYRELNGKSNHLARQLQEKGVEPGTIVAIVLERSIEMIIGLLGILKAGGAYLPIEPDYPEERINYMLKDSNAGILLKELQEFDELGEGIEIIDIHTTSGIRHPASGINRRGEPYGRPSTQQSASSLAYIIYTSGTTGSPRGVAVRHRGIVNLVGSRREIF